MPLGVLNISVSPSGENALSWKYSVEPPAVVGQPDDAMPGGGIDPVTWVDCSRVGQKGRCGYRGDNPPGLHDRIVTALIPSFTFFRTEPSVRILRWRTHAHLLRLTTIR